MEPVGRLNAGERGALPPPSLLLRRVSESARCLSGKFIVGNLDSWRPQMDRYTLCYPSSFCVVSFVYRLRRLLGFRASAPSGLFWAEATWALRRRKEKSIFGKGRNSPSSSIPDDIARPDLTIMYGRLLFVVVVLCCFAHYAVRVQRYMLYFSS